MKIFDKKQHTKFYWTIFSCMILSCLMVLENCRPSFALDLSSPESTAMEYCRGAGEGVKEIFHPPVDPDTFGSHEGWSDCKIVEVKETTEIGEEYQAGLIVSKGDVEVVFEVTRAEKGFGKFKARYWQLLRNFNGKWKIISWYRVPDKNFQPKT